MKNNNNWLTEQKDTSSITPAMLSMEYQIYSVSGEKAPLLGGMPFPGNKDVWQELSKLGFQKVVCLTDGSFPYDPFPLEGLASCRLDDLVGGRLPRDQEKEGRTIKELGRTIADALRAGESVVVHCAGGTGRTGTVLAGTLRELNFSMEKIDDIMNNVNEVRGRAGHGWPESGWQRQIIQEW